MYIVDYQTSKILIKNASNETLLISCRHKLGPLIDIAYNNYFLTNTKFTLDAATSPPLSYQPSVYSNNSPFLSINCSLEIVLDNGIEVYKNAAAIK